MPKPLVSVHMITYNHAPYIAQAIEGVLAQESEFPFELVIGEDCSTDGTRGIVRQYAARYPDRVRLVVSGANVGVLANAHRTMRACRGEYLAFCEGDDYWQDNSKLQRQADYLLRNPGCGLVYTDYDIHDLRRKRVHRSVVAHRGGAVTDNPRIEDILRGSSGILTCTVMTRRELCQAIIDGDYHLHRSGAFLMGDTQVWAEIALQADIHYIARPTAVHRWLKESLSKSMSLSKQLQFVSSNTEMVLYLCRKHKLPAGIYRLHQNHYNRGLLSLAFFERDAALAKQAISNLGRLRLKHRLLCLGARYRALNCVLRPLVLLRRRILS